MDKESSGEEKRGEGFKIFTKVKGIGHRAREGEPAFITQMGESGITNSKSGVDIASRRIR